MSENNFCVRHKNRRKHNQHFKLLFFKLNSHLGPSIYTYMQEIKFTSHKQYLLGLLFSITVRQHSYRPKYTSSFLICPNLNDSQTLKNSSCKKNLSIVCYRCNSLRWMFFVPRDNWRTLFFLKVYRCCEIFSTAMSFSLKQVL